MERNTALFGGAIYIATADLFLLDIIVLHLNKEHFPLILQVHMELTFLLMMVIHLVK